MSSTDIKELNHFISFVRFAKKILVVLLPVSHNPLTIEAKEVSLCIYPDSSSAKVGAELKVVKIWSGVHYVDQSVDLLVSRYVKCLLNF